MRSLQGHLTLILVVGMGLSLVGAGLLMNAAMSSRLLHEFDQVLVTKAKALINITEADGMEVEFDFKEKIMPEFSQAEYPEYFELRFASGTLLAKSRSLGDHVLPHLPHLGPTPIFLDFVLPNGRSGRLVQLAFVPYVDKEEAKDTSSSQNAEASKKTEEPVGMETVTQDPRGLPNRTVNLNVARDRSQLDSLLRSLHLALTGGIAGLLIIMVGLVRLALRFGLRPLDDVQQQVAQLDFNTLNTHTQVRTQTLELIPVVNQLNAMLNRLDAGFTRERQFSSDVAHELRTPLAELHTLVEVGSRWPEDRDAVVEYFADAQAICEQLESVVINLLALTRCESGVQQVQCHPLNVLDAVETSWLAVKQHAQEKEQVFECHIPTTLEIVSDRDIFLMILSNLLGNAVLHSAPKSTIRCTVTTDDSRPKLTISNPIEHLNSEDMPYLFERFWRKDSARSEGNHSGLGLSIVRAFSDLLNLEVQAHLEPRKEFFITLSL